MWVPDLSSILQVRSNKRQVEFYHNLCVGVVSGLFNGKDFLYNYFRLSVCRAVNVLKLMFLRESKYPPNAIFRNANINAQPANVTGSIIWHTNPRPPM